MADDVLFVYGTLMRGELNHEQIEHCALVDGSARTAARYDLHDLGPFPAAVAGGGTALAGELYRVDSETLHELDEFEGHPDLYVRTSIELADGSVAISYLMDRRRLDAQGSRGVIDSGDWRLRPRARR